MGNKMETVTMRIWYEDDELAILFDKKPNPDIRYPLPIMTTREKKSIEKYPFINNSTLGVTLKDKKKGKEYSFIVPKDYCWDGASIPRFFWRLIGAKTDPRFLIPSMIHDQLCEHHHYVDNDRYFADKVFERLLFVSGVSAFKRWMMFHSTDNFQKFCKW